MRALLFTFILIITACFSCESNNDDTAQHETDDKAVTSTQNEDGGVEEPMDEDEEEEEEEDYFEILENCNCPKEVKVSRDNPSKQLAESSKISVIEFENNQYRIGTSPRKKNIIENGVVDIDKKTAEVILNDEQKYRLDAILNNRKVVCENENFPIFGDNECMYWPHHIIVFWDKNNKPINFLEICFLCDNYMMYHGNENWLICNETFCDLRELFTELQLPGEIRTCK